MNKLYPYLLEPSYKDYIWGGSRIPKVYGRDLADGVYAESWELSDRPEGQSTITNGILAGTHLSSALEMLGTEIIGSSASGKHMPLLIKLIDAAQHLSVQVHPHDTNAHLTGGEPKTEMWYVLDATADARIYAGLKSGTTAETLRDAINSNAVENLLNAFTPKKGDVFFIPGGRVHAIGAGCLLLEVQQNSNTTYRVYDWGRVDAEGHSRPLHVEEAMQVINWSDTDSPLQSPELLKKHGDASVFSLLDTKWFSLERIELNGETKIESDGASFRSLFVESGSAVISTGDEETKISKGQSCLVPAAIKNLSINSEDEVIILSASI